MLIISRAPAESLLIGQLRLKGPTRWVHGVRKSSRLVPGSMPFRSNYANPAFLERPVSAAGDQVLRCHRLAYPKSIRGLILQLTFCRALATLPPVDDPGRSPL